MNDDLVRVGRADTIATVTLDVPKTRNALSRALLLVLADRLDELSGDPDCRAIVLTGANGHFCSGGDVSGMQDPRPLPVGRRPHGARPPGGAGDRRRPEAGRRGGGGLRRRRRPVAGRRGGLRGVVHGGQIRLLLRQGRADAGFGVAVDAAAAGRAGRGQAHLRHRPRGRGAGGRRLGLVDQLVEPGAALAAAVEIANGFAANAPLPLAIIKSSYARGLANFEDALRSEIDNQAALYLTADHREAVAAFMEKRPATFRGV